MSQPAPDYKDYVLNIRCREFISSGGGRQTNQITTDQALVELRSMSVQWLEILSGASEAAPGKGINTG
ncbi:hypothetical protein [Lacimicrobium alkaliphilum]|uniref:hypothetical protein n=1 Tax=Lacimicrobium alkaliphilum TaxID=1526571 RepID=UPI000BFEE307|nr:hypothetical protein [Lacimicrobium alkaliphilum]